MNATEELFSVAALAADARGEIGEQQQLLDSIRRRADDVARAWSGSNIGYHATVYYRGLEPKPPTTEFSPEWGLMDRWPTHQPDPGWQRMDYQAVADFVLGRAIGVDVEAIESGLRSIADTFVRLKETALSVLAAHQSGATDAYLARKVGEIDALKAASVRSIERDMVPSQGWSRDSLAMSQGLRLAPHQAALALPIAAASADRALRSLEQIARDAGSHIQRLTGHGTSMSSGNKKTVFVGHGRSPIWRELKDFLERRLGLTVDEFNSVSAAGVATATRLQQMLDGSGFAFLVMTGEDEQADGKLRARENVVHEAGLFQGRLGFGKAIVLLEEGCEEFSNIHGLGHIGFPHGKMSAAFEEIRMVLEREGFITTPR